MKIVRRKHAIVFLQFMLLLGYSLGFSYFHPSCVTKCGQRSLITAKFIVLSRVGQQKVWSRDANRCQTKRGVVSSVNALFDVGLKPVFQGFLQSNVIQTLFPANGGVPVTHALALNSLLFALLHKNLLSALTVSGFFHALILGTVLWTTIGWRGWSVCVLYLVMGQLVTRVKFVEKTKRGIAESRGGRRGPENVW
jgi:Integral membrane protein DUF92